MNDMKNRVIVYCNSEDKKRLVGFSKSNHYQIVKMFEKSDSDNRMDLFQLMDYVSENNIQKIIIPTATFLSVKIPIFLGFVKDLNNVGVSLIIEDNNIESLNSDGSQNSVFKLAMDMLSEFDISNRQLTRQRLSTAFRLYLYKGGKVGRKTGYKKEISLYKIEYSKELNLLRDGCSLKKCHNITGTSINTLRKLKTMFI